MIAFLFFFHGLHEKFIRSASVAFRLYPTSRFSTIFPWLSWLPSTVVTMEIHNSFECCSTLLDGTWWFFVEIFSSSGEKERKREQIPSHAYAHARDQDLCETMRRIRVANLYDKHFHRGPTGACKYTCKEKVTDERLSIIPSSSYWISALFRSLLRGKEKNVWHSR